MEVRAPPQRIGGVTWLSCLLEGFRIYRDLSSTTIIRGAHHFFSGVFGTLSARCSVVLLTSDVMKPAQFPAFNTQLPEHSRVFAPPFVNETAAV